MFSTPGSVRAISLQDYRNHTKWDVRQSDSKRIMQRTMRNIISRDKRIREGNKKRIYYTIDKTVLIYRSEVWLIRLITREEEEC